MNNSLTAVALCLPLLASAQPDPADAKAPAPPLRYQSAFADYKPWQDAKPGNWRALNDALAPPPRKPAAPASAPAQHGHHGQHMHQGSKP